MGFIFVAHAQDSTNKSGEVKPNIMKDTLDGKLDFSRFIIDAKGFIPIPMIITEPALGSFGGVLAATFFTPKVAPPGVKYVPPDLTAGLGMYTANNSWAAGGGRIGSIPKKGIKYRVFAGYVSLNLDFYREVESQGEKKFSFNIKAMPILLNISKSLGHSDVYFGMQYTFANTTVALQNGGNLPENFPAKDYDSKTATLGFFTDIDKRNNFFTPDKGVRLNVLFNMDDNWTGSDYNYQRLNGMFNWFMPVKQNWISGLRLEAQHVFSEPPFYLLPSLVMRGVPLMRYQGATTAIVETEQRYDFNLRWSAVAFGGLGKAIMSDQSFSDATLVYNYGTGFRYLIARAFKIRAGIDVAKGPDSFGWYIVFGHNWNR